MHLKVIFPALFFCFVGTAQAEIFDGKTDNTPDWFFPSWAAKAEYNKPITVRDTDSALGRYSLKTKEIGLKDLARAHGHLCDGLVISFVQIKAVLERLFPDGVVDRTDIRAISKNGPCWVDSVALMTGARISFKTLRIDNSVGNGFIIQRISTGETYQAHLKEGVFSSELVSLETKIRKTRAQGKPVASEDIDAVEQKHIELIKKMLSTPSSDLVEITRLKGYQFHPIDLFGERGDVINKNMPR